MRYYRLCTLVVAAALAHCSVGVGESLGQKKSYHGTGRWQFPALSGRALASHSMRGGALDNAAEESQPAETQPTNSSSENHNYADECLAEASNSQDPPTIRKRYTSDMIEDLSRRSSVSHNDESLNLRSLIASRRAEYLENLKDAAQEHPDEKLPHPRKVLHYLAPKIPAIKHSPDVNLRIRSARSNMDSGVAACVISVLAQICEYHDQISLIQPLQEGSQERTISSAPDVTTDRRFEQLVECVISGVNIKKRKREWLSQTVGEQSEGEQHDDEDSDEALNEVDAEESEGLNVRDSCRAAWGLAVLGAYHLDTLGGEKVVDLLIALSLRVRELLLARLKQLQQDDLFDELDHDQLRELPEERLNTLADELAEDAATAMWTFAGVKACTGLRSQSLFHACSSLLCQDIVALRQTAQDAAGLSTIGSSDIVDRLARSEEESSSKLKRGNETSRNSPISDKDVLLDWLSPNEVSDVLWALALHGSDESSSQTAILSATASVLREIAFDRIMEWLEEDLKKLDEFAASEQASTVTVEVVDAATLLQLQRENSDISDIEVENITVKSEEPFAEGTVLHEVEVVDAKKLLEAAHDGVANVVEIERETLLADSSASSSESRPETMEFGASKQSLLRSLTYSSTDLSSMAWAVTELRDPLRMHIMRSVIHVLHTRGPEALKDLKGGDLSNLAWALAKYADGLNYSEESVVDLVRWICASAMELAGKATQGQSITSPSILQAFQPPELGRLLWATASTLSSYNELSNEIRTDDVVLGLSRAALVASANTMSIFSGEDLLRITWGFLEVHSCKDVSADPLIAVALGNILATVEDCLDRWERGLKNDSTSRRGHANTDVGYDASRFASFFGRTLSRDSTVLDEQVGVTIDSDENGLVPILEKQSLPLLRHLAIDPSTLCKVACTLSRLASQNPHAHGSWILIRVAIRLLASKDARLMRECSIHDIVRLCEAAVSTEVSGHVRELSIGLFTRKVVQLLNSQLNPTAGENSASSLDLECATPTQLSTLIWSLGQLGIRHRLEVDDVQLAHRRLLLVTSKPLMTAKELEVLDSAALTKLLRGAVAMKFISSDRAFLHNILLCVKDSMPSITSAQQLCNLIESIAMVKESIPKYPQHTRSDDLDDSASKSAHLSNAVANKTNRTTFLDNESGDANTNTPSEIRNDSPQADVSENDRSMSDEELDSLCTELLGGFGMKSREMSSRFKTTELRRVLRVYCLLPHQADNLIEDLRCEVVTRTGQLFSVSKLSPIHSLVEHSARATIQVNRTLFGESHDVSRFDAIKTGIRSLFWSSDSSGEDSTNEDGEAAKLSEEVSSLIQEAASVSSEVSSFFELTDRIEPGATEEALLHLRQAAAMELGRCKEFIEIYKRIDFSTGVRKSRYDMERRRDIAKRVLSRVFPPDQNRPY